MASGVEQIKRFGRPYDSPAKGVPCREQLVDSWCCGHLTGRSGSTGNPEGSGGIEEAVCCKCGAKTTIPWVVEPVSPEGHGPYIAVKQASHIWPNGWRKAKDG